MIGRREPGRNDVANAQDLLAQLESLDLRRSDLVFETHADLDVEALLAGLPAAGFDIVPNTEGLISVVTQGDDDLDKSRSSATFDFHTDGLYHAELPRFVILYCEDPGNGQVSTKLSDGVAALARLRASSPSHCLDELDTVYVGKDGRRHARPLVNRHPETGEDTLCFGSRAYMQPSMAHYPHRDLPTLRDIAHAGTDLLAAVDASMVYEEFWSGGQFLMFDNLRYPHRREARMPDPNRRLLRLWLKPRSAVSSMPSAAKDR